jgi:hypothetical protein
MTYNNDIRLPQDTLARGLTPTEIQDVAGGPFEGQNPWVPDTTAVATGAAPPQLDTDWD